MIQGTAAVPAPLGRIARTTAADVPPSVGCLLRSAPPTVWLLTVLYGLLTLCWSVLTPIYHAPDEPNHVDAAVRLYSGLDWPPPGKIWMTADGLSSWIASPYSRKATPLQLNPATIPQSEAVPRAQRPPWDQLSKRYPPPRNNPLQLQQMVQHPPFYYIMNAAMLKVTRSSSWRWDAWVGMMRTVSVVLTTALPLLAWAAAAALTRNRPAALTAALLPFAIPQLTHINAVVNNDNALILFASLASVGLACVLRGNLSWRTALLVGVTTGLALLSKSLGLVLLPMTVASYAISTYQRPSAGQAEATAPPGRRGWWPVLRPGSRPLLLALVVSFIAGGWWYAFQLARTGHLQPQIPDFPGGTRVSGTPEFVRNVWHLMALRYWGDMGWYEVPLAFGIAAVASVLVVLLVAVALVRVRGGQGRVSVGIMLWPTLSTFVLTVYSSLHFYLRHHRVLGLQGRYLFPGVVGIAVVVAVAVASQRPRVARWVPLAMLAAATFMQYEGVSRMLDVFWKPVGAGWHETWGAITAYATWPPAAVRTFVVLAAAAAVAATAAIVLSCWQAATSPPTPARASHSDRGAERGHRRPSGRTQAVR